MGLKYEKSIQHGYNAILRQTKVAFLYPCSDCLGGLKEWHQWLQWFIWTISRDTERTITWKASLRTTLLPLLDNAVILEFAKMCNVNSSICTSLIAWHSKKQQWHLENWKDDEWLWWYFGFIVKSLSNRNELQASNAIYTVTTITSLTRMQRTHVNHYKATTNDCLLHLLSMLLWPQIRISLVSVMFLLAQ